MLKEPIKGAVLQSFGAGNVPINNIELLNVLKEACDRGVIIINCTQCIQGTVKGYYETGLKLYDLGILPGSDLTPEAALIKLG